MNYSNYYSNYLNIDHKAQKSGNFIFISDQRNEPICFYYYHNIIVVNYNKSPIISIAPQFLNFINSSNVDKYSLNNLEYVTDLLKRVAINTSNANIRQMYRMGILSKLNLTPSTNDVIQLTLEHKDIFLNRSSDNSINKSSVLERKWNLRKEQIGQGRMFVIIKDMKIISYAVISDIACNGGNISVWTDESYYGKGYGKAVTFKAAKWCIDNNILPIYLVDKQNIASQSIARSLGFEILFDEVILTIVKNMKP